METSTQKIFSYHSGLLDNMVKLKYKLMSEDVYSFYRGTCPLFYEDLSKQKKIPFSPIVWICGDLHMENFGSFQADNRLVYFDLNDFDEAILAPASWKVIRFLTVSLLRFMPWI